MSLCRRNKIKIHPGKIVYRTINNHMSLFKDIKFKKSKNVCHIWYICHPVNYVVRNVAKLQIALLKQNGFCEVYINRTATKQFQNHE